MTLHPEIPEEGPKIGTPAEHNAAGFFVGGPELGDGILRRWREMMTGADWEAVMLSLLLVALKVAADKAEKRNTRRALKARRREEMRALCEAIRSRVVT